jgi:hypothetical protein
MILQKKRPVFSDQVKAVEKACFKTLTAFLNMSKSLLMGFAACTLLG